MTSKEFDLGLRYRVAEIDGWTEISKVRRDILSGRHKDKRRDCTADWFPVPQYEISFDAIADVIDRHDLAFNLATTGDLDGSPTYTVHDANADPSKLRIVGAGKSRAIAACRWFIAMMSERSGNSLASLDREIKTLSGVGEYGLKILNGGEVDHE
jgi:hypothetical protein